MGTRQLTPDKLVKLARELRALGASHVKVGEFEVVFYPLAGVPVAASKSADDEDDDPLFHSTDDPPPERVSSEDE